MPNNQITQDRGVLVAISLSFSCDFRSKDSGKGFRGRGGSRVEK